MSASGPAMRPRHVTLPFVTIRNGLGYTRLVTWDDYYAGWHESLQANRRAEAHERLQEARKRVAQNTPDDWKWLKASLSQPQYKGFVASVFRFQPVPKRLFAAMLRAAVLV